MIITRTAIKSDIPGILELQAANLLTNLPATELAGGFVTTPFTVEQIQTAMAQSGLFVVAEQEKIAGYVFAGDWDFFAQWPIFPLMISRFQKLDFQGIPITPDNSFQYGPICIDRSLRGTGAFQQLFATMCAGLADRYPLGVTFINKLNARSIAAHRKLPLAVIDEFEFNNNSFYGLAFSTQQNW
jgi:hypothetical protein